MATDFGNYIQAARERNGFSLSEAAELIKCSKAYLWEMEQGKAVNPTIAILAGIACAYDLDLGEAAFMAAASAPNTDYRAAVSKLKEARRHLALVKS